MSRVLNNAINQITTRYNPLTHKAVDVVKYENKVADIIAHSDGVVVEVQTGKKNNLNTTGLATYGNYVKILHDNGYYTLYAHLNSVKVNKNAHVKRGDILGTMGNSGNANGTHLHFEVRDFNDKRINPTKYLEENLPNYKEKIDVYYQVYDNKKQKWLPNVINDENYAGNIGNRIGAVYMNLTTGNIRYRVHEKNNKWLPVVTNRDDYAGNIGKIIDGIQITSDDVNIAYRVHLLNTGWAPWVYKWDDTNEGYAGIIGQDIDAIQVKIMEDS